MCVGGGGGGGLIVFYFQRFFGGFFWFFFGGGGGADGWGLFPSFGWGERCDLVRFGYYVCLFFLLFCFSFFLAFMDVLYFVVVACPSPLPGFFCLLCCDGGL